MQRREKQLGKVQGRREARKLKQRTATQEPLQETDTQSYKQSQKLGCEVKFRELVPGNLDTYSA
jgi:hypothetical protein